MEDKVLYQNFYKTDGMTTYLQLVVFFSHCDEFCKLIHEGLRGIYMGNSRNESQVRSRRYWLG